MPEGPNTILLPLPSHAMQSDRDLHAVAARLLHQPHVRSVTVDHRRTAVVVRLRSKAPNDGAVADAAQAPLVDAFVAATASADEQVELVSWIDPRDRSISFIRLPARVTGWRKALYLLLAGAALLVGFLGIILPGLPTTPFVLLASYCLIRSSTRLHQRLLASRIFGGVLRDWHVHRGLRPHVRARAVAVVTLVVATSLLIARPPLTVVLIIGTLAVCGLTVIWRLPSIQASDPEASEA